jgi:hypothetical protein
MLRKLEVYVDRFGPVLGPKLYHAHQSQAAHAGVSARLRRKIDELTGRRPRRKPATDEPLPLFPDSKGTVESTTEPALAS